MIGAYIAGILMKHGRRRILLAASVIGILGVAITIYQRFYAIVIGRLIYGFACGL